MVQGQEQPSITAIHHLSFSVTDRARSVEWYTRVLGFTVDSEVEAATFRRTRLRHPDAGFVLTLTQHDDGSGDRFDETRTGLDHLGLLAPTTAHVEAWQRRLQEHGVEHSAVQRRPAETARLVFRDPDNIQLEVMAVDR